MTQEDKAKRYDEVIEELRGLLECIHEDKCNIMEKDIIKIFPELKESEDERIRKKLIAMARCYTFEGEKERQRVISWLEKQGEQKPAELSNTCEFSIKTWINIVAYVLKEHNGIGNYLDDPEVKDTAEKLQKRYKFDSASEEWDRVYRKGLDAGVNKGKAITLREKNHAWSEEDKTMVEDIIEAIDTQYAVTDYNEMVNWLKSLKDRYTWKPSEEQMKFLLKYAEQNNYDGSILTSLYQDLKKLKGE